MTRLLLVALIAARCANGFAAPPTVDWLFPAGAQRGQTVIVTAGGTFERWPVKVWTSDESVEAVADKSKGKLRVTVSPDARPGVSWIRTYDQQGATSPRPFVVGTLAEVIEAEPNDDRNKPQRLESSRVIVNGRLAKSGDVDTYAVTLRKGQTVVASMEAHRTLGSPMDAVLQIVSAEGFVLEQDDDDHGLDPQIVLTAPDDGVYLVRTFAFPETATGTIGFAGGATFVYRLTVTTGGFVDYALPLAVSAKPPGRVQLRGWNIPASLASFQPQADSPEPNTSRIFHPDLANTLALSVVSHPTIMEQEPRQNDTPQDIPLPATVTGRIDRPRDEDIFTFTAKKGQRLRFTAESRSLGYPLDPYLTLRDAAGKTLAQNDDSGRGTRDALLNYTVRTDGKYVLAIRDLHRHGGERYVYRLSAQPVQPDFALSVTADSFVTTAGKPLTIPVKVQRLDGFSAEISIRAIDLPNGVTCAPVTSAAKGKSAGAVQLSVKASGRGVAGPIRIVGTSSSGPKTDRTAYATGGRFKIAELWLTISP